MGRNPQDRTFALFSSRGTLSAVAYGGDPQDRAASPTKVSPRSPLQAICLTQKLRRYNF